MVYVITCGDEGVQVNEGTRLAFVGAGYNLDGFADVVPLLKKVFGDDIAIAGSAENDWTKKQLELSNWEQTNASVQQHIQVVADETGLNYAGFIPFADPKQLKHGVKAHMVRPQGIHIANKIAFTVSGGEHTYHLGHYLISADWVHAADDDLIKKVLDPQVAFYNSLSPSELECVIEAEGEGLPEELSQRNIETLVRLGYVK